MLYTGYIKRNRTFALERTNCYKLSALVLAPILQRGYDGLITDSLQEQVLFVKILSFRNKE